MTGNALLEDSVALLFFLITGLWLFNSIGTWIHRSLVFFMHLLLAQMLNYYSGFHINHAYINEKFMHIHV